MPAFGKPTDPQTSRCRTPYAGGCLLALMLLAIRTAGCQAITGPRTIGVDELSQAPEQPLRPFARTYVADAAALRRSCLPLGEWLGLILARSGEEWRQISDAIGSVAPEPDFRGGTIVGLVCWSGTSVSGQWPLSLEGVQVSRGAGLLRARYEGGNTYPDGAAAVELAYVPGLRDILIVDIDGHFYYPFLDRDLETGR